MRENSESKKCVEMARYATDGLMAGLEAEPNLQIVNAIQKMTQEANKMENKIYNDDVERIVNDPERQERLNAFHAARAERKQRKLIETSFVYFFFALAFAICGIFDWVTGWISYPVVAVCFFYGSFSAGRFFENGKIMGWK